MAAIDQLTELLTNTQREICVLLLMHSDDPESTWELPDNVKTYVEDVLMPAMDHIIDQDADKPANVEDIKRLNKVLELSAGMHYQEDDINEAETVELNPVVKLFQKMTKDTFKKA